ncbi:hypothetical protein FI667_g11477, partial [Globisporangium splendens]
MLDFAKNDRKRPEKASPVYMRDHNVKALQIEPNAPLPDCLPLTDDDGSSIDSVDVKAETDAMRRESEARLRIKKLQLKRFHDQICLRIAEKEYQNRLRVQQREKLLVLRLEAQTRGLMLASVRSPDESILRHLNDSVQAKSEYTNGNLHESDDEGRAPRNAARDLLPQQRVALYATVRRRYMEREREDVHRHSSKSKRPQSLKTDKDGLDRNRSGGTTKTDSKRAGAKSQESRRESNLGVKTYVAKSSAVTDVHTNTFTLSTSPLAAKHVFTSKWQRRPHPGGEPTAALSKPDAHAHSMQTTYNVIGLYQEEEKPRCSAVVIVASELRTPALCSCARNMASSPFCERPCANNCALYKHPKKREQLLTSVCKQQQGTSVRKSVSSPAY